MAILLSKNIAQCDDRAARRPPDRAAVGWAWTGRNIILDEALATATVKIHVYSQLFTMWSHICILFLRQMNQLIILWIWNFIENFEIDHKNMECLLWRTILFILAICALDYSFDNFNDESLSNIGDRNNDNVVRYHWSLIRHCY